MQISLDIDILTLYRHAYSDAFACCRCMTLFRWRQTSMTSREKLSVDCAEFDSNIIKYGFKGYKLSEIARNIYSCLIKRLSHLTRWILSLVGIVTDARKLASFVIPTRDNIRRYQCNNPIISEHLLDTGTLTRMPLHVAVVWRCFRWRRTRNVVIRLCKKSDFKPIKLNC